MMSKTTRFDAANCLNSQERQIAYIRAALETGDADFVRDALGLVARARGMGEIAKEAGLNRESLYKALGENGNPGFATVMRIVRDLGLTLTARPTAARRTSKRRRSRDDKIVSRKKSKGLARVFEIVANLPDDFLAEGRKDAPPQRRRGL
jgi:probable addiction module antidote protein